MSMRIECRESLQALREMEDESVGALITDPTYSSGGLYRRGEPTIRVNAYGEFPRRMDFTPKEMREFAAWVVEACAWVEERAADFQRDMAEYERKMAKQKEGGA